MKTYEILLDGRAVRSKFNTVEEALAWGKVLGANSLIRTTPDGLPVGKKIYNPQTGKFKMRSF